MAQVLLYANKGLAILKNVDQQSAAGETEKKMAQRPSIIQQAGGGIEGIGRRGRKQRRTKFDESKVYVRGGVGAFALWQVRGSREALYELENGDWKLVRGGYLSTRRRRLRRLVRFGYV